MLSILQTLRINVAASFTHSHFPSKVLEMIFNRNEKLNIYHSTRMSKDRVEMVKIKLIIPNEENGISHGPEHSLIIGLAFCKWTSSLISPFIQLEKIGKFQNVRHRHFNGISKEI